MISDRYSVKILKQQIERGLFSLSGHEVSPFKEAFYENCAHLGYNQQRSSRQEEEKGQEARDDALRLL